METIEITNSQDIIDVRDIITRLEELEQVVPAAEDDCGDYNEERNELAALRGLLDDLGVSGEADSLAGKRRAAEMTPEQKIELRDRLAKARYGKKAAKKKGGA